MNPGFLTWVVRMKILHAQWRAHSRDFTLFFLSFFLHLLEYHFCYMLTGSKWNVNSMALFKN